MLIRMSLAALGASLLLAGAAAAQTTAGTAAPPATAPSAAPADPAKLELARQLFQANGGAEAFSNQLKVVFGAMSSMTKAAVPAGHEGLADAMMKDVADEELKLVPLLIEDSVEVYARTFTEKELRDMLAWANSDSGRSTRQKMPGMTVAIMQKMVPHMQALMPVLMKKTLDRACDEQKCTPEVRQTVAAAMDKALASKGS